MMTRTLDLNFVDVDGIINVLNIQIDNPQIHRGSISGDLRLNAVSHYVKRRSSHYASQTSGSNAMYLIIK